jgi:hypothetical protein
VLRGRNVDTEMGIFGDEKDVPFTTMMCVGFVKGDCAVAGGTDGSLFKFEGRNLDVVAPEAHLNGECVCCCILVPCTCVLSPFSVLSPFFGVSFGHVTFFRCFIWTCVVTFSHVPLGHVFVTFSVFHLDMCLSTFSHVPLGHVFVTFSVFHLDMCGQLFPCSIGAPLGHVFVTFSPLHSVHPLLTKNVVLLIVE